MFSASLKPANNNLDISYLEFSKKYKSHYSFLHDRHDQPHMTFLWGAAGVGKSTIMRYEFAEPLKKSNTSCALFSFIPNEAEHNNDFIKQIACQLLQFQDNALGLGGTEREILYSIMDSKTESLPMPMAQLNALYQLLKTKAEKHPLYLFFEDIHLSNSFFGKFLEGSSRLTTTNLKIICTSRLSKHDHNYHLNCPEKWMQVTNLGSRALRSVVETFSIRDEEEFDILNISSGNFYCVKELLRLRNQPDNKNGKAHRPSLNNSYGLYNSSYGVIAERYERLESSCQKVIMLAAVLGFRFNKSGLINLARQIYGFDPVQEFNHLLEHGFIKSINKSKQVVSFDHHITYEFFSSDIFKIEREKLHKCAFLYYWKRRLSEKNLVSLTSHSRGGNMPVVACCLSKKMADTQFACANYGLATYYYEEYLSLLPAVCSGQKLIDRLGGAYKNLHQSYLIIWDQKKTEEISTRILQYSKNLPDKKRLEFQSLLTTAYWSTGHFCKAFDHSYQNLRKAKAIGFKDAIISSNVRCGSLKADMGLFKDSINYHDEALLYIGENDRMEKFGLFVSSYPNITSVQSWAYAELGNIDHGLKLAKESFHYLDGDMDSFSKLFVITHAAYSLYLCGRFDEALIYLEKGQEISALSKANILGTTCKGLFGICKLYTGDKTGLNDIHESLRTSQELGQIHKKSMLDLFYLEGLLMQFDVESFVEIVDEKIEFANKTEQLSFAAWLYFIKAVYYAFYEKSIQGYIGAVAKANMIAESLDLQTLQKNISSLMRLHETGMFVHDESEQADSPCFDKASFFYKLAQDVQPLVTSRLT